MQNQLTIEQLAPYLPYQLKIRTSSSDAKFSGNVLYGIKKNEFGVNMFQCAELKWWRIEQIKPYLRPLSSLTKEIVHNGRAFIPAKELFECCDFERDLGMPDEIEQAGIFRSEYIDHDQIMCYPLSFWKKLHEYHFDLYGLLDAGLALPIND